MLQTSWSMVLYFFTKMLEVPLHPFIRILFYLISWRWFMLFASKRHLRGRTSKRRCWKGLLVWRRSSGLKMGSESPSDTTRTGGRQRCDCTSCTSLLIQKWRKWSVLCYVCLSTVLKTGKSGWECLGQEPERKGECRTSPEEQETERSQKRQNEMFCSALGRQWPCVHAKSLQFCLTLCSPMDCVPPVSMRFSRQERWSGSPYPPPGDGPDSGVRPKSPAMAGGFLTSGATGSSWHLVIWNKVCSLVHGLNEWVHSSTGALLSLLSVSRRCNYTWVIKFGIKYHGEQD